MHGRKFYWRIDHATRFEVGCFSGRPNPVWMITEDEAAKKRSAQPVNARRTNPSRRAKDITGLASARSASRISST